MRIRIMSLSPSYSTTLSIARKIGFFSANFCTLLRQQYLPRQKAMLAPDQVPTKTHAVPTASILAMLSKACERAYPVPSANIEYGPMQTTVQHVAIAMMNGPLIG